MTMHFIDKVPWSRKLSFDLIMCYFVISLNCYFELYEYYILKIKYKPRVVL